VLEVLIHLWTYEARHWLVGDFILLPDHLHLFCAPADYPAACSIERWIQFWKSRATISLGWPVDCWQRKGFHHRLRDAHAYQEKWTYVRANPVRAGLSGSFEDWPFRGRIHRLEWIG